MNVEIVKAKIKKSGFDLSEWKIERGYHNISVTLVNSISGGNEKVDAMGKLFNVVPNTLPLRKGIIIYRLQSVVVGSW